MATLMPHVGGRYLNPVEVIIEYSSHVRKEKAQALIARCAAALDYEVFEPEGVEAQAGADATHVASYAAAA